MAEEDSDLKWGGHEVGEKGEGKREEEMEGRI